MSTRREFMRRIGAAGVLTAADVPLGLADMSNSTVAPKTAMTKYKVPHSDLLVSRIAYGWSSLGGEWDTLPLDPGRIPIAERVIHTAYEKGITLFDHADIYTYGKSEAVFGEVLKRSPGMRDEIIIQSKCGVHLSSPIADPPVADPHLMDSSYDHIVRSVEGSLRRLGTDHLDVLLLHKPDALVEPEEVAKAFDGLQRTGKVRYFGVSNHTAGQIALLKQYVAQPLVINQVELGLMHAALITEGLDANHEGSRRLTQDYSGAAGTLDYCRLHEIQLQAYSPVRGLLTKSPDASQPLNDTMRLLAELSQKRNCSPFAIALAWVLRHPANIVPIIGPEKPEHIIDNCAADRLDLSRSEWYQLLYAATGVSPKSLMGKLG
jgi:predicted oxidoreductase